MTNQDLHDELIWEDFKGLRDLIPKPGMKGGRYEFEAADIHEAVALAETLKALGRYQYFRGQADAAWSVTSTFARRTEAERLEALEAIQAFWLWVKNSPEMVPYLQSDDQIVAAIQHHGVAATTLVDLTREPSVAGWFATEAAGSAPFGSIYLLDHDRLSEFFRSISVGELKFRFLEVDVANLWRLQAQAGLFLEGNADLESYWPLDRIVFRQTGELSPIARSAIYPDRESHLEQMIRLHQVLDERGRRFEALIKDPMSPLRVYEVCATPAAAPSGSFAMSAAWESGPDERWDILDTTPTDARLQCATIENDLVALVELVERRRRSTELAMVIGDNEVTSGRFQALVDAIWAGMRPFPYTASEIARAITALARFDVFFRRFDLHAGKGTFELAEAYLDDPLEIEMGLFGGGSTRCCVSSARVVEALTESGRARLRLPVDTTASLLKAALIHAQGVRIGFFDEARFRALMVDEIIPWQVISKRNPTIYAAGQIEILGVP
ncbi:FRG domain-containing protein [Brevundimonas sp.]|uniref:FRG domain-containing protein n=1 Tax=Brevundimonas sp. TaxID=1871086 RepID=UPI001DADD7FC|nr:FRG domain-containing protein [Brevundimonas sp.]MBA4000157.1 hypothetical protein [Brevundimonas sp.]